MSLITDLTRMYLTRSVKPFVFANDFDQVLPYDKDLSFGLYVHIPFARVYVISALIVRVCTMKRRQDDI